MTDTHADQYVNASRPLDQPVQEAESAAEPAADAPQQPLLEPAAAAIAAPWKSARNKTLWHALSAYLIGVVLINFALLFLKGYGADLGYWQDWIRQLSTAGYDNFNGNYPPLYIHWLYLVGRVYVDLGIPLEPNNFLKFLTQTPVVLSHCLLTIMVFSLLVRFRARRDYFHIIMVLTAFNPTILVNGPIWGQVDLVPATIMVAAFLLSFHTRFCYLAIPMFGLALLTKFQMIAFAPVFGFLFFRAPLKNLLGIVIAIALGALIFLPSLLSGHFVQAFRQAYIDTLGQYPLTTFNAANLWILLTGNTAPDSQVLFDIQTNSPLDKLFIAKYFGMLLFVLTALLVFLQGIYRHIKRSPFDTVQVQLAQAFFAALVCALAFFTVLPAMHERYLFPAAVMALAYAATAQKKLLYPIVISLICALNMLIILDINGSNIWQGLSWLMVGIFGFCLLESILGEGLFARLKSLSLLLCKIPAVALPVFILAYAFMFHFFYDRYQIHQPILAEHQILLTDLPQVYAKQDHSSLQKNISFNGSTLSISNRRYAQGLGTHSNSDIQYQLPEDATEFSFMVGIDDEVGSSELQFSVWGDDRQLWQSKIYYGNEATAKVYKVDVRGVKLLNLKVAALTNDQWDHADWVNTIITREH